MCAGADLRSLPSAFRHEVVTPPASDNRTTTAASPMVRSDAQFDKEEHVEPLQPDRLDGDVVARVTR
jgi:hypothetical protein